MLAFIVPRYTAPGSPGGAIPRSATRDALRLSERLRYSSGALYPLAFAAAEPRRVPTRTPPSGVALAPARPEWPVRTQPARTAPWQAHATRPSPSALPNSPRATATPRV